jgi:hypothetical protein
MSGTKKMDSHLLNILKFSQLTISEIKMKTKKQTDERGIAHVALIIVGVAVLAVIGFAGWRVMSKDKAPSNLSEAVKQAAAKCELEDKDLCKFMASWKENKYYKLSASTTAEGKTSTYNYEAAGTDKYHMVSTGEMSYEMIGIGTTTYTKDNGDGKWWKQTLKPDQASEYNLSDDLDYSEPNKDEKEADKTTYKKLGKEACGNLQCFKYQVLDPSNKDTTEYIWFDDKDYQLRRTLSEGKDSKTDMTFSYDKVNINEPSPTKELGPNQVVVPGSSEPMTMPSEEELNQMMQGLSL